MCEGFVSMTVSIGVALFHRFIVVSRDLDLMLLHVLYSIPALRHVTHLFLHVTFPPLVSSIVKRRSQGGGLEW